MTLQIQETGTGGLPSRWGIPLDLMIIILWLVGVVLSIFLPSLNVTQARIFFTLPFMLFIPGYVLLAFIFPERSRIDLAERVALSIGLSVAINFGIGYALNFSPWGIGFGSVFSVLFTCIVILLILAYARRMTLPLDQRFVIPFHFWRVRKTLPKKSEFEHIFSWVFIFLVLAGCIAVILIIVFPATGERYTEFFILDRNRTASDYTTYIPAGTVSPMYIGVGNHEHQNLTYTIEIYQDQFEHNELLNASFIVRMDERGRFSVAVPEDETVLIPYNLSLTGSMYNRVDFLLFSQIVPDANITGMDRINASHRHLFLWLNQSQT